MPSPPLHITRSISDFRTLRTQNLLYVDKTAQVVEFLQVPDSLLFTRPRRFGKSLLLSTIEALYSGDRDLFAGDGHRPVLAVVQKDLWDWPVRPVLCLDMQVVGVRDGSLVPALNNLVAAAATDLRMDDHYRPDPHDPTWSLVSLIAALARQDSDTGGEGKIVILVDEYDAPILNQMHHPQAPQLRQELAEFYGVFKYQSVRIERLVMTGVTRFVKTGLWSRLNQVQDESTSRQFHDLVGFTDAELDTLWADVQDQVPPPEDNGPPLSRAGWREWYNGYRFARGDVPALYNPLTIMSSLRQGTLGDFWARTGHLGVVERRLQAPPPPLDPGDRMALALTRPGALADYDLDLNLNLDWLASLQPADTPEAVLAQWESDQLVPLLYQTGYFTLRPDDTLAPPNHEVAAYLHRALMAHWVVAADRPRARHHQDAMLAALRSLDVPRMVLHFNSLLPLFPHQQFRGVEAHACLLIMEHALLLTHGQDLQKVSEQSGAGGDADMALSGPDFTLVLEFKAGASTTAEQGQTQIRDRGYLQAGNRITPLYLGLALHTRDRQVDTWRCQGYDEFGDSVGGPLTHEDAWPNRREDLFRRWGYTPGAPRDALPPSDIVH